MLGHSFTVVRDMADRRPDLVLLPGLTNDARLWQPVAAQLADVATIAHGDLTRGETMADVAAQVLERAPARFALAGMSMGGYCALEIVRLAPERVMALALVDTSARPDGDEAKANREKQIERARDDYAALVEELLPKWIHASRLHDPAVAGVARAMALAAGPDVFARQQRAIMSRSDSRPLLPVIRVPTLVVYGRDDAVLPLEVHQEMASGIPGAKLVLIEASGHLAPLERADKVAAAMRDWIDRIGP